MNRLCIIGNFPITRTPKNPPVGIFLCDLRCGAVLVIFESTELQLYKKFVFSFPYYLHQIPQDTTHITYSGCGKIFYYTNILPFLYGA